MVFEEICKTLERKYGVRIILVEPEDEYCMANGEYMYVNSSFSCGDEIYIGIYENEEYKLISLFHELSHGVNDVLKPSYSRYLQELNHWKYGIDIAFDMGIRFSDGAINWGYFKASTYCGHDEIECRDWEKGDGAKLWKNRRPEDFDELVNKDKTK